VTAAIRKALRKVPGYQFARRGFRSLTEPEFRDRAALEAWITSGMDLQQRLHLEPIVFREGRAYVQTPDGLEFWWNPDVQGGVLDLEFGSDFERAERECAFSYMADSPGAVFIDVGGNCGLYSLNLLKRFNDARAYCFEPVPSSHRTIEVNANHNGLSERLTLVQKALGDKSSTVRMTASYSAMDHIVVGNGDQELSPLVIDVEMITLDGYVREHGVSRVDFMKCDVEGAELLVLKGAQNLLKEFSPPILIEIEARHTQRFNYSPQEIDSFLRNFNYEPCVPLRAGDIEKLPSIDKGIAEGHHNFLYLPTPMLH
jgi:FkbM family methyltransferase